MKCIWDFFQSYYSGAKSSILCILCILHILYILYDDGNARHIYNPANLHRACFWSVSCSTHCTYTSFIFESGRSVHQVGNILFEHFLAGFEVYKTTLVDYEGLWCWWKATSWVPETVRRKFFSETFSSLNTWFLSQNIPAFLSFF